MKVSAYRKCAGGTFSAESARAVPHAKRGVSRAYSLQAQRRRPHSVSRPYPGKSPLPAFRPAARPPTETIYSRPRKKPSADRCRCSHRQGQCSCHPHSNSTPGVSGGRLFSLRRCHAVKGTVRPAFQRRQVFIGVISHAFPPFCFPLPFSPKRFLAPCLRRVPNRGPRKVVRLCGERSRSGASELSPSGGSE